MVLLLWMCLIYISGAIITAFITRQIEELDSDDAMKLSLGWFLFLVIYPFVLFYCIISEILGKDRSETE